MSQTDREALKAILHYENFDHVPVLHFGFWVETLIKWVAEGHLTKEEVDDYVVKGHRADGTRYESVIAQKLGFDDTFFVYTGQRGNWYDVPLYPTFEEKILERFDNGSYKKIDLDGVLLKGREGVTSIAEEMGHTLVDRKSWETEYLPRLQWTTDRFDKDELGKLARDGADRTRHLALYAGSLYGKIRNYWGIVEISYLQMDDPELLKECIDTIGELSLQIVENAFKTGVKVDFVHFWEDICYNKGPLIQPEVFKRLVGPHYRKIVDVSAKNGVDIVSVDCDGLVEELVPIWLNNGVNTMFPIEVGAWGYDFSSMRTKFGKELRGVGNVKKHILSENREAIDAEVERMKRLVDLGGFIPCLDHRIPPDAEWDLVLYYCEKMRKAFSSI